VTGASSGIGTAFAKWYAENDCDVILVARDAAALGEVAENVRRGGGTAEVIVADLSHREGVELVSGQCGVVDVLVCNAGVTHAAAIGTSNRDDLDSLAYLMSAGVVRLCEAVVPGMVQRGSGDVIIVSSIAAYHTHAQGRSVCSDQGPFDGVCKEHVIGGARQRCTSCCGVPGIRANGSPSSCRVGAPHPQSAELDVVVRR